MVARRANMAFRVAYLVDCARLAYADDLGKFVHRCALAVVRALAPSAYTLLMFLAAMHRAGRFGYIGVAVAYELLAPIVHETTGRKCSVRTLERAVSLLSSAGLIEKHRWTIPDQKIKTPSGRVIKVKGMNRIQTKNGDWKCLQICILVLTPRAIGYWEKRKRKRPTSDLDTAKLADNLNVDPGFLQNPSLSELPANDTTDPSSKGGADRAACPPGDPDLPVASALEGSTTRPACGPTVEHGCIDSGDLPLRQVETRCPGETDRGGSTRSALSKAQLPARGCSLPRPKKPRLARWRNTWENGSALLLATLHKCLENFSTRQADMLFQRAAVELRGDRFENWPTSVDWSYWIGRWFRFTPAQRLYHMRRDILPLLKARAATPHEPDLLRRPPIAERPSSMGRVPTLAEQKERAIQSGNRRLAELVSIAQRAANKHPIKG